MLRAMIRGKVGISRKLARLLLLWIFELPDSTCETWLRLIRFLQKLALTVRRGLVTSIFRSTLRSKHEDGHVFRDTRAVSSFETFGMFD